MRLTTALGLALAVLGACGDDGVPKPGAVQPATEAQATAMAKEFAVAAAPCDTAKLSPLLDSKNLARRAAGKSQLRPDMKREILAELDRRGFDVASQLCLGFAPDVRFDLVRVRRVGADHRPLLRMLGGGTFNYYEMQVGTSKPTGKVQIVDMMDFYSGNEMSDLVAEGMGVGATSAMRGESFDPREIAAARNAGEWARLRELVIALPPKVRAARIFRLAELQAAMQLEDPAYVGMVEAFERDFPDDPSILMLAIDSHVMKRDMKALVAGIDRLDKRVGGDPYLDMHRAGAYLLDPTPANLVEGERLARVAIAAMPDVKDIWWILATIQLTRQDHAGVVPTLDELRTRFALTFDRDAMASEEIYRSFLASPEFEAWWATSR